MTNVDRPKGPAFPYAAQTSSSVGMKYSMWSGALKDGPCVCCLSWWPVPTEGAGAIPTFRICGPQLVLVSIWAPLWIVSGAFFALLVGLWDMMWRWKGSVEKQRKGALIWCCYTHLMTSSWFGAKHMRLKIHYDNCCRYTVPSSCLKIYFMIVLSPSE